MTDSRIEIMREAARDAINPLDGDSVCVMVHHYWGCDAETIPGQMKQIDSVFDAIAQAHIAALEANGYEIVKKP